MDFATLATLANQRTIDRDNLNLEYTTLPGLFGYAAEQHALALNERADVEDQLDLEEALVSDKLRPGLPKGATETMLKQQVTLDQGIQHTRKMLREASAKVNLWGAHVKALSIKGEMMTQLGASMRQEMKYLDPTVREDK